MNNDDDPYHDGEALGVRRDEAGVQKSDAKDGCDDEQSYECSFDGSTYSALVPGIALEIHGHGLLGGDQRESGA